MAHLHMFPPVPPEAWRTRLVQEQKNPEALARLTRILPEAIAVAPIWTASDRPAAFQPPQLPGHFRIQQVLYANAHWTEAWAAALTGGAEALHLQTPLDFTDWQAVEAVAKHVPLTLLPAGPVPDRLAPYTLAHPLVAAVAGTSDSRTTTTGGIFPAGDVMTWGGTAVEELALLAWAVQQDANIRTVELALGGPYLTDIAKLRAARLLAPHAQIIARLADTVLARTETSTNLLRTSTAAMAGVVGGADLVALPPHTGFPSTPAADRQARSTLLLLRHEVHADAVADAALGSYYIDWLTQQLVEHALGLVQQIVQQPVAQQPLFLRRQIQQSAAERVRQLRTGEEVVLGVTKFSPKGADPQIAEADGQYHPDQLAPWRPAAAAAAHRAPQS